MQLLRRGGPGRSSAGGSDDSGGNDRNSDGGLCGCTFGGEVDDANDTAGTNG